MSSGFVMRSTCVSGETESEVLPPLLRAVIADALREALDLGLPVRRDRLEERDEVRRADDVDAAREHVRREREPDERRVAAVAPAVDGDLVLLRDLLGHRPADGVEQVVVHLRGPLLVGGVDELLPEARRASVVHAQHGVPA